MVNAIRAVQEFWNLPLQLDSSNNKVLEKGCRYYNGIPLINSINGEEAVLERVFPITKKYSTVIVILIWKIFPVNFLI